MSNLSEARRVYDTVISRTLANGTTCASYFATIHVEATNLLASLCHTRGQRALVGRVCMDNPSFCPDYYRDETPETSTTATEETISHIHSLKSTTVNPIITPRFAPTCSPEALTSLGSLAASYSPPLHIQTHISENLAECALVKTLFPSHANYTALYDAFSLLTPRTILAHGVHLSPDERSLIAQRRAKISHCPASNSALGSGLAPLRDLLDAGIEVGLGTDVSGGFSPSILQAARQACLVSRLLRHTATATATASSIDGNDPKNNEKTESQEGREVLSVEDALYLATRGGALVIDMPDDLGGFDEGMFWDVQLVRLGSAVSCPPIESNGGGNIQDRETVSGSDSQSAVDLFGWESWPEKIHKWVWTGDDRNVRSVWVRGRLVHSLDQNPKGSKAGSSSRISIGLGDGYGFVRDWARWAVGGLGIAALGLVLGRKLA